MRGSLAVIVQTCDKYADAWHPFYTLYFRYWKDCPYPVYHVTESVALKHSGVVSILTGNGVEWSDRLIFALSSLKEEYVLLLLEDYFLMKQVNNEDFVKSIEVMRKYESDYLRIFPVPGPDKLLLENEEFGVISTDAPYSISTQATIWRRESLLRFLVPGESVWEFEVKGSERNKETKLLGFSISKNHRKRAEDGNYPYVYYCTAIYKGKWMRGIPKLLREEQVSFPDGPRKVEALLDVVRRRHYHMMPQWLKILFDFIYSRLSF